MGNTTVTNRAGNRATLRVVRPPSQLWLYLGMLAALAVSACGGGGGSGAAPSGPSFDLAAGLANLAASEVNATMTVSGSYAGSAQLTQSTAMASTFNGTSALAQTTAISGTGASGLQTVALSYSFEPYETSDYATLGSATDSNGVQEYLVPDSPIVFPATVKVGDSAALGSMSAYLDSALKQLAAYIDVSYMVTADPGNNDAVIVEVIYQYYGPLSDPGVASPVQTTQFDYVLTAAGRMSLQSISINVPEADNFGPYSFVFTVQ